MHEAYASVVKCSLSKRHVRPNINDRDRDCRSVETVNALRAFFVATPSWRTLVLAMIGGGAGIVAFGPLGATLALGFAVGPDMFELAGVRCRVSHLRCEWVSLLIIAIGIGEVARRTVLDGLVEGSFRDPAFIARRSEIFQIISDISLSILFMRGMLHRSFYFYDKEGSASFRMHYFISRFTWRSRFKKFLEYRVKYDKDNIPYKFARKMCIEILSLFFFIAFIIYLSVECGPEAFADGRAKYNGQPQLLDSFLRTYVSGSYYVISHVLFFYLLWFFSFDLTVDGFDFLARLRRRDRALAAASSYSGSP